MSTSMTWGLINIDQAICGSILISLKLASLSNLLGARILSKVSRSY